MENNKHAKEIILFTLITFGGLILTALISYSKLENPFSGDMALSTSGNYLGMFGVYIADFSLSIFGWNAYVLAITPIWIGFLIYKDEFSGFNKWSFVAKFLLFWVLIAASSGFFHSVISESASGWLGLEINQRLQPLFGAGVNIIYASIVMIIFSILSGISWLKIFTILSTGVTIFSTKIWQLGLSFYALINKLVAKFIDSYFTNDDFKTFVPQKIQPKALKKSVFATKKIPEMPSPLIENNSNNILPTLVLLDPAQNSQAKYSETELQYMASQVVEKLADFGIEVKVTAITPGPVITGFEISLPAGVKASKVVGLDKDLARALLVESVRVIDVIPGKPVIGLEIPNASRQMISLSEIIESDVYQNSKSPLTMCLGKGVAGEHIIMDLAKTPHLLVAGATGMGKSVGLNAMLMGILFKSNPKDVRLIMIDPKVVELAIYADIPHLLTPVVTDMNEAASALFWCVGEMERRYALLAKFGVRNIDGFNGKIKSSKNAGTPLLDPDFDEASAADGVVADELIELPLIVIIIDEYADMLGALAQEDRAKSKRCESFIIRLAQKARAAGMHLIIATQRPSVDVITGLIKSNIPSRIAFKVSSKIDSRTILDKGGAEQLLGLGDMLYMMPGKSYLTRVHGAFVGDEEITRVVENLKSNYTTNYIDSIIKPIEETFEANGEKRENSDGELDPLYDEAVAIVTSTGKASISGVQRKLRIGYNRAARIIEDMEVAGVVSSMNSSGNRQVLAPSPI